MKQVVLLLLAFLFTLTISAQVVLTYRNNALLPGDTIVTQDLVPFSPGNSGPEQVWDFSRIQFTGTKNESILSTKPADLYDGLIDFNVTLNEKGYEYFYNLNETGSELVGLRNKDVSFTLSDPVLKMKYPVHYGNGFTDDFKGTGLNTIKSGTAISGDYSFEADAYGTIILSDRIIKDVLRIKVVEKKLQITTCNVYEVKTTNYNWYAPSARYPLLGLSTRELKSNGQEPVISSTAVINPKMCNSGIILENSDTKDASLSLILFPNPFIGKLYYNYFLREQVPVSIELVDMTGKTIVILAKDKTEPAGFHTGELDAGKYNLKMGVYHFRFTYGDKVLVSKVVKM